MNIETISSLKGKKAVVMGLGLNGGGLASARFLAEKGAEVTATDLRSEKVLAPSIEKLKDLNIKYVLGQHNKSDFLEADIVIKNPAVSSESEYLKISKLVETDISLFLRFTNNPIIAVTGTKGKSSTVSALYHIMKKDYPDVRLGGNITVSPLSFIDNLKDGAPVILELSSWQLSDLKGKNLLKPEIAVITNIMHDHQNSYNNFEDYINDKKLIYKDCQEGSITLFPYNEFGRSWAKETKSKTIFFSDSKLPEKIEGAYLTQKNSFSNISNENSTLISDSKDGQGIHFRLNLLIAAMIAKVWGMKTESIVKRCETFSGIEHRMELFHKSDGVSFFNDTAATIPDATLAAIKSFSSPPIVICGGTDKDIKFDPVDDFIGRTKKTIFLAGSATDKMVEIFKKHNEPFKGPYSNLKEAVEEALSDLTDGDSVVLSPGATSFGMFLNEFDRGNQFKEMIKNLVN